MSTYLPNVPGAGKKLTDDPSPELASSQSADAGPTFGRVWVEGNTVDANGYTGLRVHARVHGVTGSTPTFSARFFYGNGAPVRSDNALFRDSLDGAVVRTTMTPGEAENEVAAFLPRGAMSLEPGDHTLQVVSALLDSQGREVVSAPAVSITARRDLSYITRVRVEGGADPFGGVERSVLLRVSFVLDHPFVGGLGQVVATFQDSRGVDVVGHGAYANGGNALTSLKEFRSPSLPGTNHFDDVAVTIPANLLPIGASALVVVEDPLNHKAVTGAVRCTLP